MPVDVAPSVHHSPRIYNDVVIPASPLEGGGRVYYVSKGLRMSNWIRLDYGAPRHATPPPPPAPPSPASCRKRHNYPAANRQSATAPGG